VAPYKRGKINPRDFCIPIDVPGAVSIYEKKEKKEVKVTTTAPVYTTVQPSVMSANVVYVQQPMPAQSIYTTVPQSNLPPNVVYASQAGPPLQPQVPFQVYSAPQPVQYVQQPMPQYVQANQPIQGPVYYVQSMPNQPFVQQPPVQCVHSPQGQPLPQQYMQAPEYYVQPVVQQGVSTTPYQPPQGTHVLCVQPPTTQQSPQGTYPVHSHAPQGQ
jgi:hypothetical protein